jgi:hypothetical protein
VPRRPRPPSTSREIGAYLCGARIKREWFNALLTGSSWDHRDRDELAKRMSGEDAEIAAVMDEGDWWHFFWQGWEQAPQ